MNNLEGVSTLTLYSRPGCHLCEGTAALLAELVVEYPMLEVVEVNIELDEAMQSRYLERIPLVEHCGEIQLELDITRAQLEEVLARAARMTADEPRD